MRVVPQLVLITVVAGLAACETTGRKPDPLPLQVQSYQTREFEVDQMVAMRSVMSVFQDLGYTIQSADKDVGFITAMSPARKSTTFLDVLVALAGDGSETTSQTRATAVVEEVRPSFTTVRLNFVVSSRQSSNGTVSEEDKPIEDPQPYQVAFDKIEDAIFIRSSTRPQPAVAGPTRGPQ